MSEIPTWLLILAAFGTIGMLYSIAVALEQLAKVTNAQNVILDQIRLAIAERNRD